VVEELAPSVIDAFEGVSPEEIPLRLDEIGR
jgi:hypothetical protein